MIEKKFLLRNTEDGLADISVLGSVFPFRVFDHKEKSCGKYNRTIKYDS